MLNLSLCPKSIHVTLLLLPVAIVPLLLDFHLTQPNSMSDPKGRGCLSHGTKLLGIQQPQRQQQHSKT